MLGVLVWRCRPGACGTLPLEINQEVPEVTAGMLGLQGPSGLPLFPFPLRCVLWQVTRSLVILAATRRGAWRSSPAVPCAAPPLPEPTPPSLGPTVAFRTPCPLVCACGTLCGTRMNLAYFELPTLPQRLTCGD